MEGRVAEIQFTEKERQAYSLEFDKQTTDQRKPLSERVRSTQQMMGKTATVYFNKLFRRDPNASSNLATIWNFASEGQAFLRLPNFMAAMRLVSALKSGRSLDRSLMYQGNIHSAQSVISRRSATAKAQGVEDRSAKERQRADISGSSSYAGEGASKDEDDTMKTIMLTQDNVFFTPRSSLEEMKGPPNRQSAPVPPVDKEDLCALKRHSLPAEPIAALMSPEPNDQVSSPQPEAFDKPDLIVHEEFVELPIVADHAETQLQQPVIEKLVEIQAKPEPLKMIGPAYQASLPQASSAEPAFEAVASLPQPPRQDLAIPQPQPSVSPIPMIIPQSSLGIPEKPQPSFPQPQSPSSQSSSPQPPQSTWPSSTSSEHPAHNSQVPVPKPHPVIRSIYERPADVLEAPPILQVSIPRSRLVSSGWLSSYVSYEVVSNRGDMFSSVERRFSDIDWLHTQLNEKYKGFIIPPRPDKKYFGSTSEKFVEERRAQMAKYLELLAAHPILSSSPQLQCFLTTPAEMFDREKQKLELSKTWEFSGFENAYDSIIASLYSRISPYSSANIKPFSTQIIETERQLSLISGPTQTFSGAFSNWVSSRNETISGGLKLQILDSSEFTSLQEEYEDLTMSDMRRLKDFSMQVRDEMLRAEGLKNAVDSYKETRDDYSKHDLLEKRKIAKQRACVDEDSMARYLADAIKTQDEIKSILQQMDDIEANIENEASQFYEKRTVSLSKTLVETTHFAVLAAERESQFWRRQASKFEL
jgi:hypothetical protein